MSNEQNPNQQDKTVDEMLEAEEGQPQTAHTTDLGDDNIARIVALEAALENANATIDGQKEAVLRARADMDNARRRADLDVEKARKFALERFAGELLPVIDNLERAMQVADAENELVKPIVEGIDLTFKSFVSTVEKFGLEIVDPQGQAFNPELHQAMAMQPSTEHAPNTVMAVMQKGYTLNGRLLRPAMVMVSRADDNAIDTQV